MQEETRVTCNICARRSLLVGGAGSRFGSFQVAVVCRQMSLLVGELLLARAIAKDIHPSMPFYISFCSERLQFCYDTMTCTGTTHGYICAGVAATAILHPTADSIH